ncbi:MAG: hypothetical protein IPO95_14525 [Rhodanobacteraceae bacterium]|jgi:hypothetical protein|nr:hypothetical protein [Rhodanobacteraceae bacterium]MBP6079338.1 hypothetical protein [Xanthomonadales bacterium]MBP7623195.1 hypothetical protein [Xanthomonadales bacterium]
MRYRRWFPAIFGVLALGAVQAADPSAASRSSVQASAQIIDGSAVLIGAGSELTLAAVELAGESAHLLLKGAHGSVTVSLRVSAATARMLAASVGAVIETVATGAGHVLILGGESIAFLLNPGAAIHRHHRHWP